MAKKAFVLIKEDDGAICGIDGVGDGQRRSLATFVQAEASQRDMQQRYPTKQYTIYMVVPITQRALTPFDPILAEMPVDIPESSQRPTELRGDFAERVREMVGVAEPIETSR